MSAVLIFLRSAGAAAGGGDSAFVAGLPPRAAARMSAVDNFPAVGLAAAGFSVAGFSVGADSFAAGLAGAALATAGFAAVLSGFAPAFSALPSRLASGLGSGASMIFRNEGSMSNHPMLL